MLCDEPTISDGREWVYTPRRYGDSCQGSGGSIYGPDLVVSVVNFSQERENKHGSQDYKSRIGWNLCAGAGRAHRARRRDRGASRKSEGPARRGQEKTRPGSEKCLHDRQLRPRRTGRCAFQREIRRSSATALQPGIENQRTVADDPPADCLRSFQLRGGGGKKFLEVAFLRWPLAMFHGRRAARAFPAQLYQPGRGSLSGPPCSLRLLSAFSVSCSKKRGTQATKDHRKAQRSGPRRAYWQQ